MYRWNEREEGAASRPSYRLYRSSVAFNNSRLVADRFACLLSSPGDLPVCVAARGAPSTDRDGAGGSLTAAFRFFAESSICSPSPGARENGRPRAPFPTSDEESPGLDRG
jgi:hypothetical protein